MQSELERLFRAADASAERISLVDGDGRVATMVITIARSRDWPAVASLLGSLQEKLGLPLPAVAADGKAGFQLWLPLAEAVAPEIATSFLEALRRQFLGEIDDKDLALLPVAGGPTEVPSIPALSAASGRWSAFIDPNMGGMFADEGGLDFEPNPDRQAELLSGISPIEVASFALASTILAAEDTKISSPAESAIHATIGGGYREPGDFLLAVMNEPGVPLVLRIDAAKALLTQRKA